MEKLKRLYGIIDFDEVVICDKEVLQGQVFDVSIGGVKGCLEFPLIPKLPGTSRDPNRTDLIGPYYAKTWKQGKGLVYWGKVANYSSGLSHVERCLVYFDVDKSSVDEVARKIYEGYLLWRTLFVDYLEFITKQRKSKGIRIENNVSDLDLLYWAGSRLKSPHVGSKLQIHCVLDRDKNALLYSQLKTISTLASSSTPLTLEQKLQLAAYRALAEKDFRKAIIETAVAAELVITKAISEKFHSDGVEYGEKLISEFRMLGGRIKLARMINAELPNIDFKSLVVEPRNAVIHKANFADHTKARRAIQAVDELIDFMPSALDRA